MQIYLRYSFLPEIRCRLKIFFQLFAVLTRVYSGPEFISLIARISVVNITMLGRMNGSERRIYEGLPFCPDLKG
jgi:hypothetical protein